MAYTIEQQRAIAIANARARAAEAEEKPKYGIGAAVEAASKAPARSTTGFRARYEEGQRRLREGEPLITPTRAPDKEKVDITTPGRAVYNAPGSLANIAADTIQFGANALVHPIQTARSLKQTGLEAIDVGKGALQHVRELSPEEYRGGAPAMDKTAANAVGAALKRDYGTLSRAANTIADDPGGAILTVTPAGRPLQAVKAAGRVGRVGALKAMEAGAEAGAGAAALADKVAAPVTAVTRAERRGTGIAERTKIGSQQFLTAEQRAAAEAEKATQRKAAQLRALAAKADRRNNTKLAEKARAEADAIAPELDVAEVRLPGDLGESARRSALKQEEGINTRMRAEDRKLRETMDAITREQEAKGTGVSDLPETRELVDASKKLIEYDPVGDPDIGKTMAPSVGGSLHSMVIERLTPQRLNIDADNVAAARRLGNTVYGDAETGFYRIIKPSMRDVDDLRREVGKIISGETTGFEALRAGEAQNLYDGLLKVQEAYSRGASKEVQKNWRLGLKAREGFEKIKTGRTLVGTQKGTDTHAVPSSQIPSRILAGGRESLDQAAAVAGVGPIRDIVASHVQYKLQGLDTADKVKKAITGTPLGEALAWDGTLESAVNTYLDKMRAAERSAAIATDAGERAAKAKARADLNRQIAETLDKDAAKYGAKRLDLERELVDLNNASPKEALSEYESILSRAQASGRITTEQYEQGLKLAKRAEASFATAAKRKQFISRAALIMGLGVGGVATMGVPGLVGGAVVGGVAPHVRKLVRRGN